MTGRRGNAVCKGISTGSPPRMRGVPPGLAAWPPKVVLLVAVLLSGGIGLGVSRADPAQEQQPADSQPSHPAQADSIAASHSGEDSLPAGDRGSTLGEQAEERPAFMLPDIVVEGEDLSRLSGGIRLLELEIPGVKPGQEPLLVEPGPTRYRRRLAAPFQVVLPAIECSPLPRALLRVSAEKGPGGSVSLALPPSPAGPRLLWCDLSGWNNRIPDRDRMEAAIGCLLANAPGDPQTRIGFGVRAALDGWDENSADDGEQIQLYTGLFWERRKHVLGLPMVVGARARGGWVSTKAVGLGSGSSLACMRPAYWTMPSEIKARWAGAEIGIATFGTLRDLKNLPAARRTAGARDEIPCSRAEIDLTVGIVGQRNPCDISDTSLRCRGHLGGSRTLGPGRIALGVAGGYGQDHGSLGPWVVYNAFWQESAVHLRTEIAPRILFAEEMLCTDAMLIPGAQHPTDERFSRGHRFALEDGGFKRGALPGMTRKGARLPTPAVVNPLLPPQRAWPRASGELLLQRDGGWVRLKARAEKLQNPLDWRQLPSASRTDVYETVVRLDRWLTRLDTEAHWWVASTLEAQAAYRWTHDAGSSSEDALLFLPEHEFISSLVGHVGKLLWGLGLHLRSGTSAGDEAESLDGFLALCGSFGWSFDSARIFLVCENLLNDEIVYIPGDGEDGLWLRLVWEYSFFHQVP